MIEHLTVYGTLVKVKNKIDGPEYREIWLRTPHLIFVLEEKYTQLVSFRFIRSRNRNACIIFASHIIQNFISLQINYSLLPEGFYKRRP